MMPRPDRRPGIMLRIVMVLGVLMLAVVQTPTAARAQTCTDCVVAAAVPLSVLQEPKLEAAVLRSVPRGSLLVRGAGAETNRYVPVSYGGVSGWVIADSIVPAPETETYAMTSGPIVSPSTSPAPSPSARVTLAPLMLRSAPAIEAEPILVIPHGGVVTLTWEGAENGYVTVDYGGVTGWAYADLLAETGGTAPPGTPSVAAVTDDGVAPVAAAPESVSVEPAVEIPAPEELIYEEPVYEEPAPVATGCDPSYPDFCIPPEPPDLNCDDVGADNFTVLPPDPHDLDDGDGIGCEL